MIGQKVDVTFFLTVLLFPESKENMSFGMIYICFLSANESRAWLQSIRVSGLCAQHASNDPPTYVI